VEVVSSFDEYSRHQWRGNDIKHKRSLHISTRTEEGKWWRGRGYHCEDGGDGRADSGAESEETGEEGEDCERNGDQEERKHESRGIIIKVLIRSEIFGNGVGTIEIFGRIEWVCRSMGSTIDVFAISRGSTNSPECPLSIAWVTSVQGLGRGYVTWGRINAGIERGDVCGKEERLIERDSVIYSPKNNKEQQDYRACTQISIQPRPEEIEYLLAIWMEPKRMH
jgi:hypothetical protein